MMKGGAWKSRLAATLRRPRFIIVGCVSLVIGTGLIVRMFWAEPSLPSQARGFFQSAMSGDVAAVAASIPDQDLRQMGITRNAAKRALALCVIPNLTRCAFIRERMLMKGEHDISGAWLCDVRMPDGSTRVLGCQVQRSDSGAVVPFMMWLHVAWAERYYEKHPEAATVAIECLLNGLTANRDKLIECGITKLIDNHGNLQSVDVLLSHYRQLYASESSRRSSR